MKLGRPTADNALAVLDPRSKVEREYRDGLEITDAHNDLATKIIEFVRSDDFDGSSEYVSNLKEIFAGERITARNFGFAASAIAAYNRHIGLVSERAAKAALFADLPVSTHIGNVKDKITVTATVVGHLTLEGQYGTTHLYKFLAEGGQKLSWFASRSQEINEGDKITLSGTVKGHDEYRGEAQTLITRCKIA